MNNMPKHEKQDTLYAALVMMTGNKSMGTGLVETNALEVREYLRTQGFYSTHDVVRSDMRALVNAGLFTISFKEINGKMVTHYSPGKLLQAIVEFVVSKVTSGIVPRRIDPMALLGEVDEEE